ncbi:hypothetical protein CsatA_001787 [Cannabis sativa]
MENYRCHFLIRGWEPCIQQGAHVLDEEWDMFEDDEFVIDLTIDATGKKHVSPTSQSASVRREILYDDGAHGNVSVFSHVDDEYARNSHFSAAGELL